MKKLLGFSVIGSSMAIFWIFIVSAPIGLGVATFTYSKGYSYFYDDPKACANCHIMQDHFEAFEKSSHHHVANCNSCHTPNGMINKYIAKAINGWNHGKAFTTGDYPWPLQITDYNREITRNSCFKCHDSLVNHYDNKTDNNCVHCHSNVGHMR